MRDKERGKYAFPITSCKIDEICINEKMLKQAACVFHVRYSSFSAVEMQTYP